ncbi:MAG: glycosyltransferase family 2 protein [Xanthobacteraceae bacterium]|nr:glycosyltransferase family 2 protein [Xanthobacteraceae bacterium]
MTETISVVVPVFNNGATLAELADRIRRTVESSWTLELIFVEDCSTDNSWDVIDDIMRDAAARVVAIRTPHNLGQHAAILVGLRHARGAWCAVLDADLQDSPEAITALMAAVDGYDAVFAGRRGRHEPTVRLLTGHLYRLLLGVLSGVPSDAGTFFVLRREAVDRILALPVTNPSAIAMIGLARLRARSIPVQREPRRVGRSAYGNRLRLRLAWRMLSCVIECRFRPAPRAIGVTINALSAAATVRESAPAGPAVHSGAAPL